jgi:hypothetical protein
VETQNADKTAAFLGVRLGVLPVLRSKSGKKNSPVRHLGTPEITLLVLEPQSLIVFNGVAE